MGVLSPGGPGVCNPSCVRQRAIIRSRKIEQPDRAALVPGTGIRSQAASGDVRGEVAEVRYVERSGQIDSPSVGRPVSMVPRVRRRSAGYELPFVRLTRRRAGDRYVGPPLPALVPLAEFVPVSPPGEVPERGPIVPDQVDIGALSARELLDPAIGGCDVTVVLLNHDVVRGVRIGLPRILGVDIAPRGSMKDQPRRRLVDFEDEQTPGGAFGSAVPKKSGDRDSPSVGRNGRERIRTAEPEIRVRNGMVQDVDHLAVRPVQSHPFERERSRIRGVGFVDKVIQPVAVGRDGRRSRSQFRREGRQAAVVLQVAHQVPVLRIFRIGTVRMRGAVEYQPPRIRRENLRFHVNVRGRNRLIRQLNDLQIVLLGSGNEVRSDFQFTIPPLYGYLRRETTNTGIRIRRMDSCAPGPGFSDILP